MSSAVMYMVTNWGAHYSKTGCGHSICGLRSLELNKEFVEPIFGGDSSCLHIY